VIGLFDRDTAIRVLVDDDRGVQVGAAVQRGSVVVACGVGRRVGADQDIGDLMIERATSRP
jgi:formylmethanofuran dehydrogenase subunit C